MLATWASGPLAALCLSAPRAAAALRAWAGRAGAAGAGFPSQGVILRTATTQGWSLASAHLVPRSGGSRITLSSPLPHTAHFATQDPSFLLRLHLQGWIRGLRWASRLPGKSTHGPPILFIPEHPPQKNYTLLFIFKSHLSSFSQPLSTPQMYSEPVSLHGCASTEVISRSHVTERRQAGLAYSSPFLHRKRYGLVIIRSRNRRKDKLSSNHQHSKIDEFSRRPPRLGWDMGRQEQLLQEPGSVTA